MRKFRYIIIFAGIVITLIIIRLFFIGSYRITSDNIGHTLKAGDCVLVNKFKTYKNPGRNRMVLYKSPLRKDAKKPPLFIGRCIGTPGDIIQMGEDGFRVNGRLLPNAPMMQPTFRIRKDIKNRLISTMKLLNIPLREVTEDSISIILRMSLKEKELLKKNISKVIDIEMIGEHHTEYEFIVPRKGKAIDVNPTSLMVCKEAIMNEAGGRAAIRDGKLYIDGEEKKLYVFKQDYFWMLSENEIDGIDSRYLGLIPKSHVMGNICFCWYSKDATRRFKNC